MTTKEAVFVTVILACCALAGTAKADPNYIGKFTLPYEVHWGRSVLPAGDYTVMMDRFEPATKIHSADGKNWFVLNTTTDDAVKGGAFLLLTSDGSRRTVRYLNAPFLGKVLIYSPLTKSEQEAIARRNGSETIVAVAAK